MLKKTMTYTDYNGASRTEDFYFHLSKAELMEMNMSTTGGMEQMIRKIINEQDSAKIVALFKEMILKSYGEKSPDGRFIKSPALAETFTQTVAYSDLFMELATDADKATEFVKGIMPGDISDQLENNPAILTAP